MPFFLAQVSFMLSFPTVVINSFHIDIVTTHIKYIFIGFDDISTEYPKNFKERPDIDDVARTKKGAKVIIFHQLLHLFFKTSNHQNSPLS